MDKHKESKRENHNESAHSNYYIGTLVTDEKTDLTFEIIDGQQRYTTIALINAVIKEKFPTANPVSKSNLNFDAREDIKHFITSLFDNYEDAKEKAKTSGENIGLENIICAVKVIENFLNNNNEHMWLNYFYDNVKIIRVTVPKGTDINHYFEIMNNRGEQLEAHEILKAKFIAETDSKFRKLFAFLWEACSQMDRPILSCFSKKEIREQLFGENYEKLPTNDFFKNSELTNDDLESEHISETEHNTLEAILSDYKFTDDQEHKSKTIVDDSKYKSIIDFPNFLLHVLKLQNDQVSLDDKKLLDEFGYTSKIEGRKLPESGEFITKLLYYRTLFDKYVIKREEGNDDWSWRLIKPSQSGNRVEYRNTFGGHDDFDDFEDAVDNGNIIMIQAMFHVTSPANNYKTWLQEVLKHFRNSSGEVNAVIFLKELQRMANTVYDKDKDNLNNGTATPRFLFNYLDYLLWREYSEKIRSNETPDEHSLLKRIASCRNKFNAFRFTLNNSVEHVAPQNPENEKRSGKLDSFGNLCLISSSTNSRLKNLPFPDKKAITEKGKQVESLKQVLIFSYDDWNDDKIDGHQKEMEELLGQESKNY